MIKINNEELLDKINDIAEEIILDIDSRLNNKNKIIEDKLDKLIEILNKLL